MIDYCFFILTAVNVKICKQKRRISYYLKANLQFFSIKNNNLSDEKSNIPENQIETGIKNIKIQDINH